ncbi:MAG: hypothetical protein GC157_07190 [Frankiales bacterium]|nr:hypothetical protein [Frankiales bacterium]
MSDRVATTFSTSPSAPVVAGPASGRFLITGQTQTGPSDEAVIVRSLAAYVAAFGARTGGTDMYDAAELAFRSGVSELVVARACGPNPVKATVSLDTGKIVVTAKDPGAYANGWTAAWDSTAHTLTIVAGSVTEVYEGTTAAALIAAAASSSRVTVTSSGTLPSSNVAATALASGTDDYANVVWATTLDLLTPDFGAGAVVIPGLPYSTVGQAIATHCSATKRHGLIAAAAGTSVSGLVTAAATARAYTDSDFLDLVGPWVVVSDGAGGTKTIDPTPFAAGLRARAHQGSPALSASIEEYAKQVAGVTPEYPVGATDWATLDAAHVSAIRVVGGYTRLYTYTMLAAMGGNLNIIGGQYRDLVNAITVAAEAVLESETGKPASSVRLAQIAGRLGALLTPYKGDGLHPLTGSDGREIDPGYRVEVSTGLAPADNHITATIGLRLVESIDFVDFTVAVGDASSAL